MDFEKTLNRPVDASGVGLHSGVPVHIRILPAPPSTGIVFVRTDLDGFTIPPVGVTCRKSVMHQPDAPGRADLHHRAPAQHVLQHGHRQRLRRDRQPRSADPRRQRHALRRSDPRRRDPPVAPPRRYLRIRKPVSVEGGGKRISILPVGPLPAHLRSVLPTPWSGARRSRWKSRPRTTPPNSLPPALSASNTNSTRCATWV